MILCLLRVDHPYVQRTMANLRPVMIFLGLLCLALIRLAFFILTWILFQFLFYLRKFYVQLLTVVFDYATKIKKDKEIIIEPSSPSVDSAFTSFSRSRSLSREASIIEENESDDGIEFDKSLISSIELTSRRSRFGSEESIQFNLGKDLRFTDYA